jgi:Fe-S-cluster-containing hydrogenase component 2
MEDKILLIDPEKCTGCRKCEMVCSLFHTDTIDPSRSRIRVAKWDDVGFYLPMTCQLCEIPFCTEVCPAKACHRDLKTNRVIIDKDKCIGCKSCIVACPFGHPFFDAIERVSVKCDFCDGEPQCVACCDTKAVEYVDADKAGMNRRMEFSLKLIQLKGHLRDEQVPLRGPFAR